MLSTLLIANRGEIALRVIRSARARGLRTVAVYSDADRGAPHVREADVAVHLGPTPALESYLNIDRLLDAARRTGADAVHPGYGFLSERAAFARALEEAGITLVGPSAAVMEAMGRKDRAREIAERAGVPVVPRVEVGAEASSSTTGEVAAGFPVLVKAAAGGGGKGMRIVRDPADLDAAIAAARREAASAFGDDTILIERYVEQGRHVEVQIMGDTHGNVVHFFERDCSAQRRHQKVLEEAPAPTVSAAARAVLLDSAVALAREVGYVGAGTVEFLVADDEVYFLEMNTRLQVEHPVTEEVVQVRGQRLDLVDLQLRVADGEPLGFTQDDVTCHGHAIEARVYAEDAFDGFLPQAGTATLVRWPSRARVDAALESGAVVGTAYDPMLGKVIATGPTRETARAALVAALDDTAVLGLTTNLGFVRQLAASTAFAEHELHTAWLDIHPDAVRPPEPTSAALLGAWAMAHPPRPAAAGVFQSGDGWRLAGPPAPVQVELEVAGEQVTFLLGPDQVRTEDRDWSVQPVAAEAGVLRLEIDGVVVEGTVAVERHRVQVAYCGHTFTFARPDAFGPGGHGALSDGTVSAPMPGTVLAVHVGEGDTVEEGQVCVVMEAMKMELALKAPYAGVVTRLSAAQGGQVALGQALLVVEAAS